MNVVDDFRRVMRGFAATVNIVSTKQGYENFGMTATAVTSVSMDPPSLLVAVNKKSTMHAVVCLAEYFCVNILGSGQANYSNVFGKPGSMQDRFEHGDWRLSAQDVPYLADAQANIFCRRVDAHEFGTHSIVIGEVVQVAVGQYYAPLVYLDGRYVSVENASAC